MFPGHEPQPVRPGDLAGVQGPCPRHTEHSLVLPRQLHIVQQEMQVPEQNTALQQFQKVTSANMPHIHIGIFL